MAWYEFPHGGRAAAQARREDYWNANCAQTPRERWLNDATQIVGSLVQVDLKFSLYLSPMREPGAFTTATRPMLTAL